MLISYKTIIEKYNLNIKNVLHVGAHKAEELVSYMDNGVEKVIWVEANRELAQQLKERLQEDANTVINAVVSDQDDNEVDFFVTNNGESSSILELGTHKTLFPGIHAVKSVKEKTKTIDSIFFENKMDFKKIDFINLDIQGAELMALRGIKDFFNVKAIYTEVNTDYVYKECALIEEIDDFLSAFKFERVETKMWHNHPWGDALYVRK